MSNEISDRVPDAVPDALGAIDIVLKKPGMRLSALGPGEMRYVVAENGVFLERRTELYTTACRVDGWAAGLAEHRESCDLLCPKIPGRMIGLMLVFFRWAWKLHGGEAALVLLHEPARRSFSWYCPEQRVRMWETWSGKWYSSSTISYTDPTSLPAGHVVFGDVLSHGDLGAFARAIDCNDERHIVGVHIIAGHIDSDVPSFHVDFVMDGRRFAISADEVFERVAPGDSLEVPEEWKERVIIERDRYRYSRAEDDRWR